MEKNLSALGFMSGTSGDGVDTSVISSNGKDYISIKYNRFDPYPSKLSNKIHRIKEKISKIQDLLKYFSNLEELEKEITNFHVDIAIKISKRINYDLIGFHGHTIYHNADEKISKQIGLGNSLSRKTNKTVVYNFRQNDIKNGGEGAPLAPIYHLALIKTLFKESKVKIPISILNIGGIANITEIDKNFKITSRDIGPGNCLIDKWMRKNSNKSFDKDGNFANKGKIDKFIFDQYIENYYYSKINSRRSLDTNDFDISFAKGLSFENGTTTITDLTSELLSKKIGNYNIYVCGGGRKNKYLINSLKNKIKNKVFSIDDLSIDGDFVESQAFAFLAIRSYLGLPISFPSTTNCKIPTIGGSIIKNS
ncbi:anhydro-N-acetylmuramic acid kinase [Pelagibacterales bacterium SAG-MED23]|nr:anhydro-N-acetylmuramic acid kinase [Pelagibacterales bacterium SAG-MED23]